MIEVFSLYVYFEKEMDSANTFNDMASQRRQITSLFQSSYAQKLEMIIHYCVILVAVGCALLKLQKGGLRGYPSVLFCKVNFALA